MYIMLIRDVPEKFKEKYSDDELKLRRRLSRG